MWITYNIQNKAKATILLLWLDCLFVKRPIYMFKKSSFSSHFAGKSFGFSGTHECKY